MRVRRYLVVGSVLVMLAVIASVATPVVRHFTCDTSGTSDSQGYSETGPVQPITDIGASLDEWCGLEHIDFTVPGDRVPDIMADYVPGFYRDMAGNPITVQGNIVLRVFVTGTLDPMIMREPLTLTRAVGWATAPDVHYVGTQDDAQVFAIGLSAKYPFRLDRQTVTDERSGQTRSTVSVTFVPGHH